MDHNWERIAPPEDNGIMCTECFQCKCCGPVTERCKGYADDEWFNDTIREG